MSDPAPELLGELVKDRECADRITEVWIGELMGPRITDDRFRELKCLPHLKTIQVTYVREGDALLRNIKGITTLEELSLYRAGVTAEGIRHVAGFPNLKRLSVNRVDDACREELEKLQKALPNCRIHWVPMTEDERKMLSGRGGR
jgi:hypothetical protein